MASGTIARMPIVAREIAMNNVVESSYADQVETILTGIAPQSWPIGMYGGSFRAGSGSSPAVWSGYYNLQVTNPSANWATMGFVIAQGRLFNVWYQQAVWAVTEISNDSGANHCKMPDGTLIQWGTKSYSGSIPAGSTVSDEIVFAIPFINGSYAILCNMITSVPTQRSAAPGNKSATKVAINIQNSYTSAAEGATYYWAAFGRWK